MSEQNMSGIDGAVIHRLMQGDRAIVHCDCGRQFPARLPKGETFDVGDMVNVDLATRRVIPVKVRIEQ